MMKVYAVVDRQSKSVVNVFSSSNDETAKRSFEMLLSGPLDNIFSVYYQQFDLYPVCELDLEGLALNVTKQGFSEANNHGFKVDTFQVVEPVCCGSDFSFSELDELRKFRFPTSEEIKVSEKEGNNNE